ncbi:unnamed protein product [Litomosoides sigmodontis]|uniref:Uncharacterized protein n=1 Tax=Litomosoides sigmodontis TaxID=42156 RepID=A0A3P7JNP3_LITSI|nr:unnamed protein product [Litomosoides sigmodontis]
MQQVVDDTHCSNERCRMKLLPTSSSSAATTFHLPITTTTLNMQWSRTIHKPFVQCYDNERSNDDDDDDNGDNNDNSDDGNGNNSSCNDKMEKKKMRQDADGSFLGSNYHYLQIDRNSINILLKVVAAFVLLCIAGCLMLQHLRISQLDYRIRRIELSSAHSIQV